MTKLHRSVFLKEAKSLFPELRGELNRQYGLLHLEMHVFCDFVQRLIEKGEEHRVIQAFQFAERMLRDGNSDLVNALTVSFLEHLNFEDGKVQRAWAHKLMPQSLAQQHAAIVEYNRAHHARDAT